jgi:two-component sensor histidine kinase
MMYLVDDLLDVSRITQGKIALRRKSIDLRDAIAKAIEIATPILEQRQHHFDVDVPPHPIVVDGDEARLTQVFGNLLTNAAKYTPIDGHIAVTVRESDGQAVVEVRDDGTGIDPELLPRVFDLFVQGPQSVARSGGGLGLGLTLVRSLVNLHGGQVEAHSEGPGRGSRFIVRLSTVVQPITAAPARASALPVAQDRQRILIVDDNEDARLLLSDILEAIGHDVRTAGDGIGALEVVKQFIPDVAILDIGLPVMDGSAAAGFDRHLVKPVEMRKLLATLVELQR